MCMFMHMATGAAWNEPAGPGEAEMFGDNKVVSQTHDHCSNSFSTDMYSFSSTAFQLRLRVCTVRCSYMPLCARGVPLVRLVLHIQLHTGGQHAMGCTHM